MGGWDVVWDAVVGLGYVVGKDRNPVHDSSCVKDDGAKDLYVTKDRRVEVLNMIEWHHCT